MNLEYLNKEHVRQYKELIDECFGGSNDLEVYEHKYNEDGAYKILVARDGDRIAGSLTFYPIDLFTFSFQPAIEIFNVAVLKEYRGQKIARKLFDFVIDYAKENEYKSIFLTCLESAHGAHRLYESIGFKRVSSVKFNLDISSIDDFQ